MAKRTPRSQADDATAPAPVKSRSSRSRSQRPAGDAADANVESSSQASGDTATPGAATFAARPEANDQAVVDASVSENRSTSMASEPSEEDIRLRAYHRYLERGGGHGLDFDDWVEAERELKTQKT